MLVVISLLMLPLFHYLFLPSFMFVPGSSYELDYFTLTENGVRVLKGVGLFVLMTVIGGSLFKLFELESGAQAVAQELGAREIKDGPSLLSHHRQILNVVQEIALACGLATPRLFEIESDSINALASGTSLKRSCICITTGAIKSLTRDEQSALVAHEMAHILNGDASTNIELVASLHGFMLFQQMGSRLFSLPLNRWTRGAVLIPVYIFAAFLYVVGVLGYFFGKVLQSYYSQQREFLADAQAVQYTRSDTALIGLLEKIWRKGTLNRLKLYNAEEFAHFFFASPVKHHYDYFETHPPLIERARKIRPKTQFKEVEPERAELADFPYRRQDQQKAGEHQSFDINQNFNSLLVQPSFSKAFSFSLFDFCKEARDKGKSDEYLSTLQAKLSQDIPLYLQLRFALTIGNFDQLTQIQQTRKMIKSRHSLNYYELELNLILSTFIAATNSGFQDGLEKYLAKELPWMSPLVKVSAINIPNFIASMRKLENVTIEGREKIYQLLTKIISWDRNTSFEEEEFLKLLCLAMNIPIPKNAN